MSPPVTNARPEQSIDVKPSYGLTDTEIERMLEESIDYAEEDVTARLLIEARNDGEALLQATDARSIGPRRTRRNAPTSKPRWHDWQMRCVTPTTIESATSPTHSTG